MNMKKKLLIIAAFCAVLLTACKKSDFEEAYTDPSKISVTSVEKQFAGFLFSNSDYVIPNYWNYFVVMRTSVNHYTQVVGWVNSSNQYVPGAAAINDRWNNYYNFLAQYREFQKVYNKLSTEDQAEKRIYMILATIYFYDHTQKVVDLHGDIPWSEAGMLSQNNGEYEASLPKYDKAEDIYTKMLDDLKGFSDEFNSISISDATLNGLAIQDFVNNGNIGLWQKYCNSLRLRMLNRVSGVADLQSRANTEIAAILGNSSDYPVIADNSDNIQIDIFDLGSSLNATGFRTGLEDWDGNIAGKAMVDNMKANGDPRLRAMFEPGASAEGVYNGLDQMLDGDAQTSLIAGGTISIYNRSTFSRNQFFPGVLMNAAEVSFIAAEYYLRAGNDGAAKTAYNNGIAQSIKNYYLYRTVSNDNTAGDLTPTDDAEIAAYVASAGVKWDGAANKMNLIATQKWLHYSVLQQMEAWAEQRRMNLPQFSFVVDNANTQTLPPNRWLYAGSESVYNTANYSAVKANDNLTTKIFWDVN